MIVDKCPPEWAGGNGYFTAGAHRTVHYGLADILSLVSNVTPSQASQIDLEPYTAEQFAADIQRLSGGRSDKNLVDTVVSESRQAIQWLKDDVGVDFTMSFNRQAYEIGGRQVFWGGMALSVREGGKGLIQAHSEALEKAGVTRMFNTRAVDLVLRNGEVEGLRVQRLGDGGQTLDVNLTSPCVVLAAGGFEANRELREQFLGKGWGMARVRKFLVPSRASLLRVFQVRGTPYNTGDGFDLARRVGAKMTGDWGGCHSTCWDANANADQGERGLTNQFTKSGYPLGIMVNSRGDRFVDEGEDFRNYTYAKFGRAILMQPQGFAFQIWDSKVFDKLRQEEYGDGVVEKIRGDTLEELAGTLCGKGLESSARGHLVKTIREFNEGVEAHHAKNANIGWDPAVKDGKGTLGLPLPKSNWALAIDEPPFMAVKVSCGITFTFGGLAIDPATAGVVSEDGGIIKGLYCTGEMVGGLFYGNYPGGSGLTAGAIFGCKAGRSAAQRGGGK